MINKFFYIIILVCMPAFLQAQHIVAGKVVSGGYSIKGILVVNIYAEREARTDSLGKFSIQAKTGDKLIITDPGITTKEVMVDNTFFEGEQTFFVEVNDAFVLDEVIVEKNYALTSEALGLVPKNQKKYTPQERKLYTAGDFKTIHLLGLIGGSLAVDPILNAINGRTKALKKTVSLERKEAAIDVLNGLFTEQEVMDEYKIPQEYVKGFFYYCVEEPEFAAAGKANNTTLMRFLMSGLAIKYLTLINEPNNKDDK